MSEFHLICMATSRTSPIKRSYIILGLELGLASIYIDYHNIVDYNYIGVVASVPVCGYKLSK